MKRSLRSWLWRVPLEREVDEELALHVEMRTRELVERGVDPATARKLALSRLGDVASLKRCRAGACPGNGGGLRDSRLFGPAERA